jgi:hypothetical protein
VGTLRERDFSLLKIRAVAFRAVGGEERGDVVGEVDGRRLRGNSKTQNPNSKETPSSKAQAMKGHGEVLEVDP